MTFFLALASPCAVVALQTYLKICGAEVTVSAAANPLRSPNGQFPVLRHQEAVIASLDDILLHLKQKVGTAGSCQHSVRCQLVQTVCQQIAAWR